jgi:exodeoxyribonuclease VII small subunit
MIGNYDGAMRDGRLTLGATTRRHRPCAPAKNTALPLAAAAAGSLRVEPAAAEIGAVYARPGRRYGFPLKSEAIPVNDTPPSQPGDDIAAMPFEQALAELESIVDRLERGEVSLEDSIAIYERGEALKRHCEALLKDAEMRIEKITHAANGKVPGSEPFDVK